MLTHILALPACVEKALLQTTSERTTLSVNGRTLGGQGKRNRSQQTGGQRRRRLLHFALTGDILFSQPPFILPNVTKRAPSLRRLSVQSSLSNLCNQAALMGADLL